MKNLKHHETPFTYLGVGNPELHSHHCPFAEKCKNRFERLDKTRPDVFLPKVAQSGWNAMSTRIVGNTVATAARTFCDSLGRTAKTSVQSLQHEITTNHNESQSFACRRKDYNSSHGSLRSSHVLCMKNSSLDVLNCVQYVVFLCW